MKNDSQEKIKIILSPTQESKGKQAEIVLTNIQNNKQKGDFMLSWSITFFIIALIAGLLGFTGIAGSAVGIAKILFFVFLVLFVINLLFNIGRKAQ